MASDREAAEQALQATGFREFANKPGSWVRHNAPRIVADLVEGNYESLTAELSLNAKTLPAALSFLSAPADATTPLDALTPQQVERVHSAYLAAQCDSAVNGGTVWEHLFRRLTHSTSDTAPADEG